jgi:hypothetical protein
MEAITSYLHGKHKEERTRYEPQCSICNGKFSKYPPYLILNMKNKNFEKNFDIIFLLIGKVTFIYWPILMILNFE